MKALRTFPRPEPRRTGNAFIVVSMLLSFCILSFIKARYCSAPYVRSQSSQELKAPVELVNMVNGRSQNPALQAAEDEVDGRRKFLDSAPNVGERITVTDKPICFETSKRSNVCDAEGDVRIRGSSQTIFLHPSLTRQEWKIKPYARKHDAWAMSHIKEWSVNPFSVAAADEPPPSCTHAHTVPALVFSTGGFTGNLFHDFTDVLVPLFISAHQFNGEVQFVIADLKSWWVSKFALILKQLSNYEIIDADADDRDAVRCFPRVIAGLSFHKELGVDPARTPDGYSVMDFKAMLRRAYGLERPEAKPSGDQWDIRRKPRLLIISRKRTRTFLNERGMADMAMSLGFDVKIGSPEITNDLGKFARLVNSADVMLGVHGAGLTNMVFLPAGAVLIQVVPFGGLGWLARDTFQEPSLEMEIQYFDYHIQADESTLSEEYSKDDPVLKDPYSIHKQGWNAISKTYLEKQNVRPHLGRLRKTLLEALRCLPHRQIKED